MAFWLATTEPVQVARSVRLQGDVVATNLLVFREAAVAYYNANPVATGIIANTLLAPYFPLGFIPNPTWVARIDAGTLYVYANTPATTSVASKEALVTKTKSSLLVGVASGNTLFNITTGATGITLPSGVIPDGALVIVGK